MTKDYWLNRWERGEIGFHQEQFNPYLNECWPGLQLHNSSKIFVPLCGKSRDMIWLQNRGYSVLGVECSELAVKAFFRENALIPSHSSDLRFENYTADKISIVQGDFFNLEKNDLGKISAVYDRASLVALPPETRQRYVQHMSKILPPATQILLISFDYPQSEMQGPPYAVSPDEVYRLYHEHAEISLLRLVDVLKDNLRFQQLGLSRLQESVFLLKMKP